MGLEMGMDIQRQCWWWESPMEFSEGKTLKGKDLLLYVNRVF